MGGTMYLSAAPWRNRHLARKTLITRIQIPSDYARKRNGECSRVLAEEGFIKLQWKKPTIAVPAATGL
jgi:hypothetical protein